MKRIISCNLIFILLIGLASCANRTMSTVGDAAMGGVASHQLTGGSTCIRIFLSYFF